MQFLDLTFGSSQANSEGYLPQLIPAPVCIPNLTLTGSYVPHNSKIYEVSNKISTIDYELIPVMSQITLSAGNYIEMLPNTNLFSGESGAILAKIGGCDAGP